MLIIHNSRALIFNKLYYLYVMFRLNHLILSLFQVFMWSGICRLNVMPEFFMV